MTVNFFKRVYIMEKKKILIVDDDQGTTLSFKLGLETSGYSVDTFNDPEIALNNFKPGIYALSLIDIRMQGMNGFELVQELKKVEPDLRVCFITSFKTYYEGLLEQYPNMDHKCFIQKPISINELLKHVEKAMDLKQS